MKREMGAAVVLLHHTLRPSLQSLEHWLVNAGKIILNWRGEKTILQHILCSLALAKNIFERARKFPSDHEEIYAGFEKELITTSVVLFWTSRRTQLSPDGT